MFISNDMSLWARFCVFSLSLNPSPSLYESVTYTLLSVSPQYVSTTAHKTTTSVTQNALIEIS